jgi:hypothetical protein
VAILSSENQIPQSCPEASPVKWHQAHTTWFFETFVFRLFLPCYRSFREELHRFFNSLYILLDKEIPAKELQSSFPRPTLNEILTFRCHVDQETERLFASSIEKGECGATCWA